MMKNTLLASMGFEDHDLKTPLHDEIVLWCIENQGVIRKECGMEDGDVEKVIIECPVKTEFSQGRDQRIVGYVDVFIEMNRRGLQRIAIEVKTKIPSLGELIRQLRTLDQYGRPRAVVVVCPDDRFAEVIRSQGYFFVRYSGPTHVSGDLFGGNQ